MSVARADLVDRSKWKEKEVELQCVHGDTASYPVADVICELDGWKKEVSVAVVPGLPIDFLIGCDDHLSFAGVLSDNTSLPVMTRSQKRNQMKESSYQQGGDGAAEKPEGNGPASARGPVSRYLPQHPEPNLACGSAQERMQPNTGTIEQQQDNSGEVNIPDAHTPTDSTRVLQATPQQLREWQQADSTLKTVRELAHSGKQAEGGASFCYRDGLLYRLWSPDGNTDHVKACEQLILPLQCRSAVLQIAHDVPTAGHLGINKTRSRILCRYYWPGVFKEVADHCRSCEVCQRSPGGNRRIRAEMVPMPLVERPFERIAMDIVGPLPRSKAGNKYILTVCDYATRYPEAIPLPSIEAERIAKELVKLFSRVGIPDEILTDQGTNFMSVFLQEIYRLLHIKRIRTTPYHPQTDGLVERFNGTLKAMLRKLTSRNQKDWDELLPYLLFAYREVPQESTGFAPFELLYGRRVRGPLDVLREVWSGEEVENVSVAAHVIQMRDRLQEMSSIARENLVKAQKKQKRYYDERARPQALEVGDKVLVLAPTKCSKLQLEWAGPYSITRFAGITSRGGE
jgi:hypothetical protein